MYRGHVGIKFQGLCETEYNGSRGSLYNTLALGVFVFCFSLNSGVKVWDVMLFQKARIFNEPRPENRSIQPSFIPGGSEIMKSVWISQTTLYDFAWCYIDPHCFPWFEMTLAESSMISNTFSCLFSFLNNTRVFFIRTIQRCLLLLASKNNRGCRVFCGSTLPHSQIHVFRKRLALEQKTKS